MSEKKEIKKGKKITKELLFELGEKYRKIEIEGLGADIYVKSLSGFERRVFHQMMADDKTVDSNAAPATMIPVLIALSAVDECGCKLFGTAPADIKAIDELIPSSAQNKIFGEAAKLNGLTETSIDESVKN